MLALLFSGQGAQKVGMGRSLYDASPAARALYDAADDVLGWSLRQVSFEGPEDRLTQTGCCQPALYVHGCAVLAALRERGEARDPFLAAGLSLGEITALAAAGVFDFATGLRVVAERGRLMQAACEATRGTMASILGEERAAVEALCLEFDIDLANINSPGQIVVSGEVAKVGAAVEAAKARGMKKVIPLQVAGAYHSRLMEPARAAFEAFLAGVPLREPSITVLTNVTGGPVRTPDEIRAALVRQVVSPVQWVACMETAAASGATRFLECGMGGVLAGLARRTNKAWSVASVAEAAELPPAP